ncbi:Hypothetical predicted protein [Paramuricea clavata]|uniref:Uncharacterized protein n=1 Tax=Paramuricea clavata TaxID=317549 RepID=A0A6S7J4M9_PARCT|nr:Hypothetical predicted protein [Paramuricea clavata]
MNSDHFEKHHSNKHKGLGTSKVVVKLAQTTLQFCNNIYGKKELLPVPVATFTDNTNRQSEESFSDTVLEHQEDVFQEEVQIEHVDEDEVLMHGESVLEFYHHETAVHNIYNDERGDEYNTTVSYDDVNQAQAIDTDSETINTNYGRARDDPDIQVSDDPEIPWIVHAAEIKRLENYSHQCDSIITKALSSEVIYPEELLTDVLEAISKGREHSTNMEKNCATTLHEIRESNLEIDFTSLQYPADRSRTLSDQQKQKIIENGPYQPKLKRYPESQDVSTKKECRFSSGWYKEYPHPEYSVKEDTASCFVCCLFPTGVGRERSSDACVKGVKG